MVRRQASVALAALAVLLLPGAAPAAPGDADPTFGSNGRVVIATLPHNAQFLAAAVQGDGKLVLAGYAFQDGPAADADFLVVRLEAGGSLDPSFGTGGIVTTPVNVVANGNDFARAVALGPGGTIVVAGSAVVMGTITTDLAVARYTSAGMPDTTFGGDGIATLHLGSSFDTAFGVVVQPDAKVVAAGQGGGGLTVARLEADGDPDLTFAGDGIAVASVGSPSSDSATAVVFGPGGTIVVGGTQDRASGAPTDFALARFEPDGDVDGTFGTGGTVVTPGPGQEDALAIAVDPRTGKLYLAGVVNNLAGSLNFRLARYSSSGELDPSFGSGGIVTTPVTAFSAATGVAVQADGKILAGGWANVGVNDLDFAAARYLEGGALDPTFGDGGARTYAFGAGADVGNGLVLQPFADRVRAVLAGLATLGSDRPAALGLEPAGDVVLPPPPSSPPPPPRSASADICVDRIDIFEVLSPTFVRRVQGPLAVGRVYGADVTVCNRGLETALVSVEITYGEGRPAVVYGLRLSPGERQTLRSPGAVATKAGDRTFKADAYPVGVGASDPDLGNNRLSVARAAYHLPLSIMGFRRLDEQAISLIGTAEGGPNTPGLFGSLLPAFEPRLQRVAKVEVAILQARATGKAARNVAGTCRWLRDSRARFVRRRATRGRCTTPVWLRAKGTTRWTFRLRQGLPDGRYVASSRATNRAGLSEDRFSAARGNRRTFTVRRRDGR